MTDSKRKTKPKGKRSALPTTEERKKLLAQMKAEFDEARKDPAKWQKEQDDRKFWNQLT